MLHTSPKDLLPHLIGAMYIHRRLLLHESEHSIEIIYYSSKLDINDECDEITNMMFPPLCSLQRGVISGWDGLDIFGWVARKCGSDYLWFTLALQQFLPGEV